MLKALDSNLNNSINEFYEFRNFNNTWSQDNNYTNLLYGYGCKPVKKAMFSTFTDDTRYFRYIIIVTMTLKLKSHPKIAWMPPEISFSIIEPC